MNSLVICSYLHLSLLSKMRRPTMRKLFYTLTQIDRTVRMDGLIEWVDNWCSLYQLPIESDLQVRDGGSRRWKRGSKDGSKRKESRTKGWSVHLLRLGIRIWIWFQKAILVSFKAEDVPNQHAVEEVPIESLLSFWYYQQQQCSETSRSSFLGNCN